MNFHILTLFPDMVLDGLHTSIIGRAVENGLISIEAIDIREYSTDKHRHVDDYPYGGGAGMVMQPMPICDAYDDLCDRIGKKPRVIYLTPQGTVFSQKIAEELAAEEELVFLCGHYEGVDERALELVATDYLSIGDYVLTGGELHGTKCSLVGDFALATIRKIRANKCFIGVSGITAEGEISTAVLQETMVNSLMIERAKDMVVILADHKRIGKLHNFIIADTHQITHIVTDELADEAVTSRLEKDNVTILKGHVTD